VGEDLWGGHDSFFFRSYYAQVTSLSTKAKEGDNVFFVNFLFVFGESFGTPS
jgi:hypothetical protein